MPFGKYRGKSLDEIADGDPGYIVWLADERVLRVEREFLDACRMDDYEDDALGEALMDWRHGDYGNRDDGLDPGDRNGAFRND